MTPDISALRGLLAEFPRSDAIMVPTHNLRAALDRLERLEAVAEAARLGCTCPCARCSNCIEGISDAIFALDAEGTP
jgi:hypothetical protein